MLPAFRRIANDIIADINDGELKPGDRLPSTTDLCAQYKVSPTVINQTMILLGAMGYVTGRSGLGRFVTTHE